MTPAPSISPSPAAFSPKAPSKTSSSTKPPPRIAKATPSPAARSASASSTNSAPSGWERRLGRANGKEAERAAAEEKAHLEAQRREASETRRPAPSSNTRNECRRAIADRRAQELASSSPTSSNQPHPTPPTLRQLHHSPHPPLSPLPPVPISFLSKRSFCFIRNQNPHPPTHPPPLPNRHPLPSVPAAHLRLRFPVPPTIGVILLGTPISAARARDLSPTSSCTPTIPPPKASRNTSNGSVASPRGPPRNGDTLVPAQHFIWRGRRFFLGGYNAIWNALERFKLCWSRCIRCRRHPLLGRSVERGNERYHRWTSTRSVMTPSWVAAEVLTSISARGSGHSLELVSALASSLNQPPNGCRLRLGTSAPSSLKHLQPEVRRAKCHVYKRDNLPAHHLLLPASASIHIDSPSSTSLPSHGETRLEKMKAAQNVMPISATISLPTTERQLF